MDPSTTLITFMLQRPLSTRTVHLVGSWDNFTTRYPMERDLKRGNGEWRGCYSFGSSKRNGALKMGETYYYYYEVDGETEVHNDQLPSTTFCQYLPGQPVNLLSVPIEEAPRRQRSASVGAADADADFKTMNPADKYLTPRAPPAPPLKALCRLNTSTGLTPPKKRNSRSLSPAGLTSSAKNFFGLRSSPANAEERGRPSSSHGAPISPPSFFSSSVFDSYPQSSRMASTDVSPLSRPTSSHSNQSAHARPTTSCANRPFFFSQMFPAAIEEEDDSDDDEILTSPFNFMSQRAFATELSPPPSRRQHTLPALSQVPALQIDEMPHPQNTEDAPPTMASSPFNLALELPIVNREARPQPRSHFSLDTMSTLSPTESHFDSPWLSGIDDAATDASFPSFLLSESPVEQSQDAGVFNPFRGYSLPLPSEDVKTMDDGRLPTGKPETTPVAPASSTLDELLVEMGYLGDVIEG